MMGVNRYKLQHVAIPETLQVGVLPLRSFNPSTLTDVRNAQQMKLSFDLDSLPILGLSRGFDVVSS